jgi:methionine sulfoxide reductase heme-binding subunit
VIALTSPYLWYTTRATALVTLVLFTLVVALGTFVATRVGGTYIGRFEVNELHRSMSMVAIVFLGFHVTSTVIDSYVPTGVISIFVPMTSIYKRVPIALGAVALDLILAVWISSLLKVRIANTTWRFIHWFSWLGFATSVVHAFLSGTDARHGWGLILVAACSALVAASGIWRFFGRPTRAAGRTALSPLATLDQPTRPDARPGPPLGAVPRRSVAAPPRSSSGAFPKSSRPQKKKR